MKRKDWRLNESSQTLKIKTISNTQSLDVSTLLPKKPWLVNDEQVYTISNTQVFEAELFPNYKKVKAAELTQPFSLETSQVLAVKALLSISSPTKTSVHCTTLKSSTTLALMKCQWMWPTWSKLSPEDFKLVQVLSARRFFEAELFPNYKKVKAAELTQPFSLETSQVKPFWMTKEVTKV